MSDWNVIHENFHTKHSVLTAPDEHMPYVIQLHIMSIRWAYYKQMKQHTIWSVHMTSIGKENRSSQSLSRDGEIESLWGKRRVELRASDQKLMGKGVGLRANPLSTNQHSTTWWSDRTLMEKGAGLRAPSVNSRFRITLFSHQRN